jgi:hypothetical protein
MLDATCKHPFKISMPREIPRRDAVSVSLVGQWPGTYSWLRRPSFFIFFFIYSFGDHELYFFEFFNGSVYPVEGYVRLCMNIW